MIRQFEPFIKRKWAKNVYNTIMKGNLGPGSEVKLLEREIELITKRYCVLTTSGTTALLVAIKSLDLKPGSTILLPSYSFIAAHHAAKFLGYKVRLIDIDEDTLCMNPDQIKITKDVSCLIYINHNGYNGYQVVEVADICKNANIPMIEDSSQALGIKGAGTVGDIGIFSFSVPKIITGGQGGAIVTSFDIIAKQCRDIIDHGGDWRLDRIHKSLGINLRYNDICASYVLAQIKDLQELLKKRQNIFNWYEEYLVYPQYFGNQSPWMIVYKSEKADKIIEELDKKGIKAVKYYKPIHHNRLFKTKRKFPIAEKVAEELIYLPSSLNLKKREIKRICQIIKSVENNN